MILIDECTFHVLSRFHLDSMNIFIDVAEMDLDGARCPNCHTFLAGWRSLHSCMGFTDHAYKMECYYCDLRIG